VQYLIRDHLKYVSGKVIRGDYRRVYSPCLVPELYLRSYFNCLKAIQVQTADE
jgi:hypothetical protein